ncbi:hypothetical protein TCAL_08359 [Tigriopus californicus]|uniref:THAP-type domain-containing protein n=1 Tax=Tigriopus californicus TaxID=6832 RepID=A0A553PF87_TIGCA|nr:uncharacterized protein LOC131881423 [Tigriopus californicus]TRY76347.1 hypothetical protein TCAL_08359 [Tigriopus californicus]
MVGTCIVMGCAYHADMTPLNDEGVQFFPIPEVDAVRRMRWLAALKPSAKVIKDQGWPPPLACVCSRHFVRGKPNSNPNDIDFVPSILPNKGPTPRKDMTLKRIALSPQVAIKPFKKRAPDSLVEVKSEDPDFDESTFEDVNPKCYVSRKNKLGSHQKSVEVQCKLKAELKTGFIFQSKSLPCTSNWRKQVVSHLETQCYIPHGLHDPIVGDVNGLSYNPFLSPQNTPAVVGLPNLGLDLVVLMLKNCVPASGVLSLDEQVMLFLMKLKHNLPFSFLGPLFRISENLSKEIFLEVLRATALKAISYEWWHSMSKVNFGSTLAFMSNYDKCRGIYDFMEIMVQPKMVQMAANPLTFPASSNSAAFKMRTLMVVTPSASIAFLSEAQSYHISEVELVNKSGILDRLHPGDVILSDEELPKIIEESMGKFVTLSPDSSGSLQGNKRGASPRKFVLNCAQKMRSFQIINYLENDLVKEIDNILTCVAFLTNHFPDIDITPKK